MVAITSGANMDFDRLRFVSERADDSEKTLAVTIPETPGSFRMLYSLIWPRNVTEFSYRYESDGAANILISFQPLKTRDNDFNHVISELHANNIRCIDLADNELAKVHVRHLAGGRSSVEKERLFRFHFPESPGALQRFLSSLDMSWNVSLFHYRNHGDDFGRVLVGIQVGQNCKRLQEFLDNLGYAYCEETDNPVYLTFLRNSRSQVNTMK
jgi:threonine dehydratase